MVQEDGGGVKMKNGSRIRLRRMKIGSRGLWSKNEEWFKRMVE